MSDIRAIQCDITSLHVDAIVNAANATLLGGGGVDGAIHAAAGPGLLRACQQLGGCAAGEAKMTDGYDLPARFVIHTVGPVWRGGGEGEADTLVSCYHNSLRVAVERGIASIAFPAIATGVYGYPAQQAARIAIRECLDFLDQHGVPELVIFACFDAPMLKIYQALLGK
ncbi:O-acetyl-ADP-ribose deacetylase [Mariprofundus erugo]|uniref:O-acetyl-ADP-ribose deacetylase n=1 Tax=Mariprofundus erugo TaxID=2528639 RepID=A0A5R9GK63_9PROT|nr:O-acetyl-ADP-ribose deacetylase [Mariprofundus erugo]TLS65459.1 O-acetyl-ADP-ribose deacetylase [Mariprofundus erugo]TLS75301.1 O-acetyl-ADP-ribose deacetylase [Mariprofundus erugo]